MAVSIGIVTSGELKAVLKGLRKGELSIVKFLYNTKITISPVTGNLYATFIPIVVKLNMTKIVSNGLVSAITQKDTFLKLISYAKKAEYQSLVPVFEKAVAETSGFKDLINGSPVAVDVFFGLAKQNPSIAVEEIVGVSNLARNLPDESIATFVTDLGDAGLRAAMLKESGLVDGWKTLDDAGYAALKKNPASLEKVSNLLKNSKLVDAGLDEGMVSRLIKGNRNAGGSAVALDDLTKGLGDLVSSGTKFEDIGKLVTDLEKGGNFAEGAGWIQRYITSNVNEFSGKTLIFESLEKAGETVKHVDVKMPDGNITRYFEFKSVSEIPPSNFATQFVKDMQISDVSDLGQIKWLFDGKKVHH